MEVVAIESLGAFITEMSKLQQVGDELRPLFWFRGHARNSWKLLPGVLRDDFVTRVNRFNIQPDDADSRNAALEKTEQLINDQFRRKGASLFSPNADPVDIYLNAQHFGMPTRLLDWTANPLAALFFAASEAKENDGEVVAIVPDWRLTSDDPTDRARSGVPDGAVDQRDWLIKETLLYLFDQGKRPNAGFIVPLRPDLRSGRMFQQEACFTLHMPGCHAINETAGNSKRFRIPSGAKAVLMEELRACGVNWATLFPDLDHLAKEIREDWKLYARPSL